MKSMSDAITLGKVPEKNRYVRSATFEYGGDENGQFRQNMYDTTEALAKDGVGLIITGMVAVDENAGITLHMIKTFDNTFVDGLSRLADLAHLHPRCSEHESDSPPWRRPASPRYTLCLFCISVDVSRAR